MRATPDPISPVRFRATPLVLLFLLPSWLQRRASNLHRYRSIGRQTTARWVGNPWCRALFSTVSNECNWNPDVIERQLAHIEGNKVRAAYHRSTYLEDRTKLVQWWADYLDGCKAGNVVPMAGKRAA